MVLPTLLRFSSVANSLAHINMIPDADGTLRWEALAIDYQGDFYAPIGLQAAWLYRGLRKEDLVLDYQGAVTWVDLDPDRRARPHADQLPRAEQHLPHVFHLGHSGPDPAGGHLQGQDRSDRRNGHRHLRPARNAFFPEHGGDREARERRGQYPARRFHPAHRGTVVLPRYSCSPSCSAYSSPGWAQRRAPLLFLALFAGYLGAVYYLFVAKGIWFNMVYPGSALFFGYTARPPTGSLPRSAAHGTSARCSRATFRSASWMN